MSDVDVVEVSDSAALTLAVMARLEQQDARIEALTADLVTYVHMVQTTCNALAVIADRFVKAHEL